MTLILYNNKSDKFVMHKDITELKSMTGTPTEDINILTPTFIIENTASIISRCNYCFVAEFNRYYYVTIDALAGTQLRLNCTVDPLMSHASELAYCPCTVVRSESEGKPTAVIDNKLPVDPNREDVVSILLNKDPFNAMTGIDWVTNKCYVLTVLGTAIEP